MFLDETMRFIIEVLDDTHVFVDSQQLPLIQEKVNELLEVRILFVSFVPNCPRKTRIESCNNLHPGQHRSLYNLHVYIDFIIKLKSRKQFVRGVLIVTHVPKMNPNNRQANVNQTMLAAYLQQQAMLAAQNSQFFRPVPQQTPSTLLSSEKPGINLEMRAKVTDVM